MSLPYAITVALRHTVEMRGRKTRMSKGLRVTGLLSLLETLFQSSSSDKFIPNWVEAHTGFEPVQSDWKSEVLPLHKYAVEDHLKLSVHNGKERIQTQDGGQFILHQLR